MTTYAIGEAAKMVGVSTRAIRLWEAKGLLPLAERTASRYRVFTDADLSSMRFIRQAKLLGLTLSEIKRILSITRSGTSPCDEVREVIDKRVADIDRTIVELEHLRHVLVTAKSVADNHDFSPPGNCVCEIIEAVETRGR